MADKTIVADKHRLLIGIIFDEINNIKYVVFRILVIRKKDTKLEIFQFLFLFLFF